MIYSFLATGKLYQFGKAVGGLGKMFLFYFQEIYDTWIGAVTAVM